VPEDAFPKLRLAETLEHGQKYWERSF
jgi:hypothetical protein